MEGSSLKESFYGGVRRPGGGTSEGPEEWSRQPEKWSGRSSMVTQNLW
jgi:hypothetical protein